MFDANHWHMFDNMWVEQPHDTMVTSHTSTEKENANTTDKRVDVASTRPPIAVCVCSCSHVCTSLCKFVCANTYTFVCV